MNKLYSNVHFRCKAPYNYCYTCIKSTLKVPEYCYKEKSVELVEIQLLLPKDIPNKYKYLVYPCLLTNIDRINLYIDYITIDSI